jgi:hypothetical protein
VVESSEEGIGVFVAQQIGSFIQLTGRVKKVMPGQLTTCFFQQTLKRNPMLGEPPLQRPSAQV